jgi:hypothetical protein
MLIQLINKRGDQFMVELPRRPTLASGYLQDLTRWAFTPRARMAPMPLPANTLPPFSPASMISDIISPAERQWYASRLNKPSACACSGPLGNPDCPVHGYVASESNGRQ